MSHKARVALLAAKVDLESQAPPGAVPDPIEAELAESAARKATTQNAERQTKKGMNS